MHPALVWAILAVGAYLVGAIPVGLLMGFARGVDIRDHGSGNIGATNAMRVLGRRLGLLCFALDVGKGLAPTLLAGWITGVLANPDLATADAWAWLGVAACPVLGHIFPVWLRFRGGKGVATGLGSVLGVFPQLTVPALLGAVVWIVAARLTRYVGVASCVAGLSVPLWTALAAATTLEGDDRWRRALPFLVATGALAALVVWRHRGNIARTLQGVEPRIGARKSRAGAAGNPSEHGGAPAQPAQAGESNTGFPDRG
jgi:glycerol-3-phosphate acyltransferase PlsY